MMLMLFPLHKFVHLPCCNTLLKSSFNEETALAFFEVNIIPHYFWSTFSTRLLFSDAIT